MNIGKTKNEKPSKEKLDKLKNNGIPSHVLEQSINNDELSENIIKWAKNLKKRDL